MALLKLAEEYVGADSLRAALNKICELQGLSLIVDHEVPVSLDCEEFRRGLGKAAKAKNKSWFKDITRGERLGAIIAPCLSQISKTPLAMTIANLRRWIDG